MDRLFAVFVLALFFSSGVIAHAGSGAGQGPDFGTLITEGYSEQAQSYDKMKMHPRSLAILHSLAKTAPVPDRKIKVRLVKKRVMVASVERSAEKSVATGTEKSVQN